MHVDQPLAHAIPRLALAGVALAIGTAFVTAEAYCNGYLAYLWATFRDEWPPFLVRVLLASAPFLLLAVRGVSARLPWLVGLVLTGLVWAYVVRQAASGRLDRASSVGSALWMALIAVGSSIVITLICGALARHRAK